MQSEFSVRFRDFRDRTLRPSDEDLKSEDKFHGYPILGKVELKELAVREQLVDAFKSGSPGDHHKTASCFWPRHAISTISGEKKIDYVICFECIAYRVNDGDDSVSHNITRTPQSQFNKILKDAGLPLAP